MMAARRVTDRRKGPTRKNIFGFGRKPAPVPVARRGRTGGLSLSEASSAALKAGRTSGDLSDFDSWLERKHLDTRSDAVISRIRDSYKRGVDKADADEQNREFLKQKREQAREAARDARASAGRGGKVKAAAASSGYASAPDEETIQRGFKRGLTLNEILRGNPGFISSFGAKLRVSSPGLSSKQLAAYFRERFGSTKLPQYKEFLRAYRAGRGNPAAASAEVFEEFHGYPPSEVVTVSRKRHYHKHVASAGDLVGLQVKPINKGPVRTIEGLGECFLAFNEAKNQLFIEGGDQRMPPKELKKFGIRKDHELQTLGKLVGVGYFTNKKHLGSEGGEAVYSHVFRTTNEDGAHVTVTIARFPDLIYRVLDEQYEVSGGSYEILREGINK